MPAVLCISGAHQGRPESRDGELPTPTQDPESLTELGQIHMNRYESLGDIEDLEQAAAAFTRAMEVVPDGKPDIRTRVFNYGLAFHHLSTRYDRPASVLDVTSAFCSFQFLVEITPDEDTDKSRMAASSDDVVNSRRGRTRRG
ncbi:hypothetical protein PENSPDRAFT_649855 [Peniophora sp. CONT]|nr:hypothetical protein PENSPDRAFT_649855 [Peniophora sp. CONT]